MKVYLDCNQPGSGVCIYCQQEADELRYGCCWDCALTGERRAAQRSVLEHALSAIRHLRPGYFWKARYDAKWAFERLTRTGDYRPGGYFEREGHI